MKDYVNPVLLLIVIILIACRTIAETPAAADALDLALWTLCATAVLTNGALGLARALSKRPSVFSIIWAVVFFITGCFVWTMRSAEAEPSEEQQRYRELSATHLNKPLERDSEGENLLTRAAALGQVATVQSIINHAPVQEADLNEAGLRAAEANKVRVLDALAARGLSAKAVVQGTPLLHAAAQNGACEAMEWALVRGALPNSRDDEGTTALIHATLSGSAPAVRLLLEYGADTRMRDTKGYSPADYAHTEELQALLAPAGPEQ